MRSASIRNWSLKWQVATAFFNYCCTAQTSKLPNGKNLIFEGNYKAVDVPSVCELYVTSVNTYNKEGMVCGSQNPIFCEGMCNLIFLNDDLFLEYLDGIQVPRCLLTTQDYLAKCAFS
jgi:hypothetical protein